LVATALSILTYEHYFVSPAHTAPDRIFRIALFVVIALFMIWIIAAQKRAAGSLRRARDDLQAAVQELERANDALRADIDERERAEDELRQRQAPLACVQRLSRTGSLIF